LKKVAIATSIDGMLDHFGHCETFMIYEINDQVITGVTTVKNPEHQKGALPKYLYDLGVTHVITQNIGAMALKIMEGLNLEAIYGVNGKTTDVIQLYLNGKLVSSNESCKHHDEHDHSVDHEHEHHHDDHHKHHHE
jgi:predicted Fe-Mo cluster-binding NifX family protein